MNLLVSNHTSGMVGGAELYLASVLPALRELGWNVATLFEVGEAAYEFAADGSQQLVTFGRRPGTYAGYLDVVRRWKPDVLLQNGLVNVGLERDLLRLAPSVLFAHGFYGTCISGNKRFAMPSLKVCHREFGVTCLALYHSRRCGGLNPITMVDFFLLNQARKALLREYAHICVASEALRAEYLLNGVAEGQLAKLPLFPDRCTPDAERPVSRSTDGPVLFVGRLVPQKGGAVLLKAAEIVKRLSKRAIAVQFIGEGPERPRLEQLARELGIEAEFFGWCDVAVRQALMRKATLLAVASTAPESFGIVGLDAGCVGLPAVAFLTGGISEWLIDVYSGIAADGERPRAENLATAIMTALEDSGRYQRLRAGAWEVSQRFSLQKHVRGLNGVLQATAGAGAVDGPRL